MGGHTVLTAAEIAARWRAPERTVKRLFRLGRIKGFKVGREWRARLSEVEAYENDSRAAQGGEKE